MSSGIVDTNVLIDILRKNPPAITWLADQREPLAITPITWMEVMYGVQRKEHRVATLKLLDRFEMIYLTQYDMRWAMDRLQLLRSRYSIEIMDYLIASVSQRLTLPMFTHNLKHMCPLLGVDLVIKPYEYN